MTHHGKSLFSIEQAVDIIDNLTDIIVGKATRPSCADAISSVGQHHRDDGNVPLGLHSQIIVVVILEYVIIHRRKQQASQ